MANMLLSITLVSILMKVNFCANWTFRLWKNYDIKMINRLIHLSEGYIYFKDKPISDYQYTKCVGILDTYCSRLHYSHMTIKENIAQVPQMKKWKEKDIDKRVDELLEMVGLEPEKYKTENLMNCQGTTTTCRSYTCVSN